MSPIVAWNATVISAAATRRPLTAAEMKALARVRSLLQSGEGDAQLQPAREARDAGHRLADGVLDDGALSEHFYAYRCAEVTGRTDGSLWPKIFGRRPFRCCCFQTNYRRWPLTWRDRAVARFTRTIENDGPSYEVFWRATYFGELGGGTLYNSILVIAGRPVNAGAGAARTEVRRRKRPLPEAHREYKSGREEFVRAAGGVDDAPGEIRTAGEARGAVEGPVP